MNFVPIVVPSLSSETLWRQESHCSTSSSSSSSSPTASEIKTREREDRIESDISPVTVSTTVDERSVRPDDNQAIKKKPKTKKGTQEGIQVVQTLKSKSGCKNSGKNWWTKFQKMETQPPVLLMKYLESPHSRDVRIWLNRVFILISLNTEIARSASGPK